MDSDFEADCPFQDNHTIYLAAKDWAMKFLLYTKNILSTFWTKESQSRITPRIQLARIFLELHITVFLLLKQYPLFEKFSFEQFLTDTRLTKTSIVIYSVLQFSKISHDEQLELKLY